VALECALATAVRKVSSRFGQPCTRGGEPARCVLLAFGKLGGEELNYSSDVDLMFLYDEEGGTRGRAGTPITNDDFFARVISEVMRLLTTYTDRGLAYRIDLRLRPEGQRGPLARSLASTLAYYDTFGRTWERQALIKVRPIAGDMALGQQFLEQIEPFVYRRYLSWAEINGIKAHKRQIEQRAARAREDSLDVKIGRGGIRDVEFIIQFLQLLNGGDLPAVRQRNTLLAMQALEDAGCLTHQEHQVLEDAYRFLRKTEHRLQLMFDLQMHTLPENPEELRKLAQRMGYPLPAPPSPEPAPDGRRQRRHADELPAPENPAVVDAREAFLRDYHEKTGPTRRILEHLLHDTFVGEAEHAEPETDLVLDPDPDPETIRAVLGKYPFRNIEGAYHNLTQLARESVPFLSTRRCRHFLASIAPQLLRALAETPDPDMALVNLEKVTASLGAKSVLWELFSFNPPCLRLYVDLCAWSQFLSEILINNPGMIDELLDTLVLNQPRTREELREELADLCRGVLPTAEVGVSPLEQILHSFQDKELLRIGVRDVLNKESIRSSVAALSDLAEVILERIAEAQYPPLEKRFGTPILSAGPRAGQTCRHVLLGLGKFGGGELNYHSDLDLILVYEGDGRTVPPPGAGRFHHCDLTENLHFFTELAQRIVRLASYQGPMGKLYAVDMRLRPTGRSGSLVTPLAEFRRYFDDGGAQLWERQAMTRARVVHGDAAFGREVMAAVAQAAYGLPWQPQMADEVMDMRRRLEASRGSRDLKRGPGGLVDIEFLVQLFQIKYAAALPALRSPNTWTALAAIRDAGLLTPAEQDELVAGYDFLLRVQNRLRIVSNRALDELPEAAEDIEKLARRLGYESAPAFLAELDRHSRKIRETFLRLLARERETPAPPSVALNGAKPGL
jgi:glutamate-ammonia-ligase adenylyltransferase